MLKKIICVLFIQAVPAFVTSGKKLSFNKHLQLDSLSSYNIYFNTYKLKCSLAASNPLNEIEQIAFDQVTDRLYELISTSKTTSDSANIGNKNVTNETRIALEGYITHVRSYGSALAFINLVASKHSELSIQVLFKKDSYDKPMQFKTLMKSLKVGHKVYIEGVASTSEKNQNEVILMAVKTRILDISRNVNHIKGLLPRIDVHGGDDSLLSLEEMCVAFHYSNVERMRKVLLGIEEPDTLYADDLFLSLPVMTNNDEKQSTMKVSYAKIARLIHNNLPNNPDYPIDLLKANGSNSPTMANPFHKSLPLAPADILDLPPFVMSNFVSEGSVVDSFYEEKSIHELGLFNSTSSFGENSYAAVQVSGWVQNRKRFKNKESEGITIIWIVNDFTSASNGDRTGSIKCILNPKFMNAPNLKSNEAVASEVYGYLCSRGSRVLLQGRLYTAVSSTKSKNTPILMVQNSRILRNSWRPSVVRAFLSLLREKNDESETRSTRNEPYYPFDLQEVSDALDLPGGYAEAKELRKKCSFMSLTEIQWKAAEISQRLQNDSSRMGQLTKNMQETLNKYSSLRERYRLQHVEYQQQQIPSIFSQEQEDTKSSRLLKKSTQGSRWQRAKRPQLEWMGEQIKEVIQSHPLFGVRSLNILDIGGGRGYLANYLASEIGENVAHVHVVDIDQSNVRNGMMQARRQSVSVRYAVGDASDDNVIDKLMGENDNGTVDVVVALHACGALSDVALSCATRFNASFVITPCCYRSNSFLRVSIVDSDNQKEKMKVTPAEWLGIDENDLYLLTSLAEFQGDIKTSSLAAHSLGALRAIATRRYSCGEQLDVTLRTFPISFSTRNLCIVGKQNRITQKHTYEYE